MAQVKTTQIMKCSIDQLLKAITDYGNYPKYLDGTTGITILSQTGTFPSLVTRAQFEIEVIKTFKYTLELTSSPTRVSWKLVEGDLFKKNDGAWDLKVVGPKEVEATYTIDLDVKLMVPGMVMKKITSTQLPTMFSQFERWAQSL